MTSGLLRWDSLSRTSQSCSESACTPRWSSFLYSVPYPCQALISIRTVLLLKMSSPRPLMHRLATDVPQARRAHEMEILRHYHRCLVQYGVKSYPWEQCVEDYKFQFFRVLIKILVVAPGLVRDRKLQRGMFAKSPTKGDKKLLEMYKEMNTRLAAALMDHKWDERLDDLSISAGCCRVCN